MSQAKASLSRLVERVLAGEEVAIGRRGRPEVVLQPYHRSSAAARPLGDYDGPYRFDEDFADADAEVAALFGVDG